MAQQPTSVVFPYNNVGTLQRVTSTVLRQKDFEHDILTVEVYGYRGRSLDLRSGDPVKADLTVGGRALVYVGYVHHVTPKVTSGANAVPRHSITMVGASYPMKDGTQKIWRDVTLSDVATQLARKYRLTADIEPSPTRLPMINQTGLSDWAFLVKQAKRIGWVCYVNGTVLSFHSRAYREARRYASAPRLTYRNGPDFLANQVYEFSPLLGESSPAEGAMKARRTVRGVDPRTATVFSSHHDGAVRSARRAERPVGRFTSVAVGDVVNSGAEAVSQAAGSAEASRYAYRAKARTVGLADVHQGSLIFFENLPGDYDGYWTVLCVEHRFLSGKYEMLLELGTDSIGQRDNVEPSIRPVVIDSSGDGERLLPQGSILVVPGGDLRAVIASSHGDADAALTAMSLGARGGTGISPDSATGAGVLDGSGAVGGSSLVSSLASTIPFEGPIGSPSADILSSSPQVFQWRGSVSTLTPTGTEIQSPGYTRGTYVRRHNGR